jgi:hypothetical protein
MIGEVSRDVDLTGPEVSAGTSSEVAKLCEKTEGGRRRRRNTKNLVIY